jgi:hypothetical protein
MPPFKLTVIDESDGAPVVDLEGVTLTLPPALLEQLRAAPDQLAADHRFLKAFQHALLTVQHPLGDGGN